MTEQEATTKPTDQTAAADAPEAATEAEATPAAELAPEAEAIPVESGDEQTAAAVERAPADEDEAPADVDEAPADVDEAPADVDEVPADVDEAPAEEGEAPADAAEEDEPASEEEPELDPKDAEIAEIKDKLLRAAAEVENIRRRAGREREEAHKFAVTRFARDLCEVADNLRRAIDSAPEGGADDDAGQSLIEGVRMTERVMLEVFARHGIHPIEPKGERFDPNLHEAMTEIVVPDADPGTVVQVFQTGYVINERLLRPARVIVATSG